MIQCMLFLFVLPCLVLKRPPFKTQHIFGVGRSSLFQKILKLLCLVYLVVFYD